MTSIPGEATDLTRQRTCPACKGLVPDDGINVKGAVRACPHCGAALPSEEDELNPYAAPAGSFEEPDSIPTVPATLTGKYIGAFTFFFLNFHVIAPLVLFINIPANLLINYYKFVKEGSPLEILQLALIVSVFFGPIPIGGIHYVLSRRMSGERVTFFEAVSHGMNRWLPLLLAQIAKGLIIFVGLFALIVPAFYFAARYALLDPVVVLEDAGDPRLRSAELVQGKAWEILGALAIFSVASFGLIQLLQTIPRYSNPMYEVLLETGLDCVLDLFSSVGSVLIFLYYWERLQVVGPPAKDDSEKPEADWSN